MPTLLLTIFLIQLLIHLVNTIGASTINELLWTLYTSVSAFLSSSSRSQKHSNTEQARLRSEVVRLKREMAATSAQDNFAKWAKIRREHDRALQRHDEIAAAASSLKSKFTTYASTVRWISTNGVRLLLQFWYARTAVFRLPAGGWVPWWVEWVVGFPRAAKGTGTGTGTGVGAGAGVSVQVWGWVCVVVIGLVGELVVWGVQQILWVPKGREKGTKMGEGGGGGGGGGGGIHAQQQQ